MRCRMEYKIYQLKDINCDYGFMSWDFAQRHNFSVKDYKYVYGGCVDGDTDIQALEKLYVMFNVNHPSDFKGHSLSVSDVIVLTNDKGERKIYYCDPFGWETIENVQFPNRMNYDEMVEYLLDELKDERNKMLMNKENKYSYIFMLCNDMGIVEG